MVIARPGSGKSRSVFLPNLALYEGSVVVIDPKPELVATAPYREVVIGMPSLVFDPLQVVPQKYLTKHGRARIDPIDYVQKSVSPLTAAYRVAEALIPPGTSKETHWPDAAANYFAAAMLYVAFDPRIDELAEDQRKAGVEGVRIGRNLRTVWMFLSKRKRERALLRGMVNSPDGFISDQGSAFYGAANDNMEIKSIRNHLRTNLAKTLGEPKVLDSLSDSNVDFSTLNHTPQSVYCCLPGWSVQTHFRLSRLFTTIVMGQLEESGLRPHNATQPPTQFFIDETATLGKFTPLVEGMGRLRGNGARFTLAVQNLSQLKALYGDDMNTIMGNCGCIQFFGGTNDTFTAEYLSQLCGTMTVITGSGGSSFGSQGASTSTGYGMAARRLIMPDEIMRLPMPIQLIKLSGEYAAVAEVVPPDLRNFPALAAFLGFIDADMSHEQALWAARQAHQANPPRPEDYKPPQEDGPVPVPARKRRGIGRWLDDGLAGLLGHETE